MRNESEKAINHPCGSLACDLCAEIRDPELVLPVSLLITVNKKLARLRSDRERVATAIARQDAVFSD